MSAAAGTWEVLARHRVVACVGAGGVGKTTLAAALGLGAARRGHRALVLTIDPARRLADALGVGTLGPEPSPIARPLLTELGVPAEGELHAMMLDMKRTFDDLVTRFAPDPAARERILENRIYQHVSDALAGSAEYSAMEKVYEMSARPEFDVVVLDTPPSAHALDFLEAPERLIGLLDSRIVQLLLHPAMSAGRLGLRWFQRGAHQAFQLIERITGFGFLEDISEFLLAFEGMSEGFRRRAESVRQLLFGPETAFVLASGASPESVAHSRDLLARLEARGAKVSGVIANRVRCWPDGVGDLPGPDERAKWVEPLARSFEQSTPAGFPARDAAVAALAVLDRYAAAVSRDAEATAPLLAEAAQHGHFVRRIPELPRDVHDLEGLVRIENGLFEPEDP
ncbi:MAG: ArsA-related P-loop ATPase [Myxococcota bacterium]